MKNIWIVVGVVVVLGLIYFGIKASYGPSNNLESGPIDTAFDEVTPESTSIPSIVATQSPVTSPVPSESPALASPVNGALTVSMVNNTFQPDPATVAAGTTITFVNNDQVVHDVTFAAFQSSRIQPGGTYTHVFNIQGTFSYRCTLHPKMTGTVIVQ